MSQSKITQLEETLAHTLRTVDELNEVVTAQQVTIDRLTKQVTFLLERERDREEAALYSDPVPVDKPPHY